MVTRICFDIKDVDVELSLARIASLKVRNFAWHPAYKHTTKQRKARKTGFIAQELIKIIPEAVEKGKGVRPYFMENLDRGVLWSFRTFPELAKRSRTICDVADKGEFL